MSVPCEELRQPPNPEPPDSKTFDPGAPDPEFTSPQPACRRRLNRDRARLTAGLVAFVVGVSAEEILSATRGHAALSSARHLVMYLLHAAFSMSLGQIADAVGRDRSTVAYGVHRIEDRREAPAFDRWLESLEEMLRLTPEPWPHAETAGAAR